MAPKVCSEEGIWVFGYGSIMWRPGFLYEQKQRATLIGYERQFCQASHDHRGTPESPGRVVTLVSSHSADCVGIAFQLLENSNTILSALDIREQDGYKRVIIEVALESGSVTPAITWIASEGNSSWRYGESLQEVVSVISTGSGSSGSNRDYLYNLQEALSSLSIKDNYVDQLSDLVRRREKSGTD